MGSTTAARARPVATEDATTDPGGRRVLVVDDDQAVADSMAMVLEALGYRVRLAHDGPQALAAAADFRPAVVLLDIGMPGMDGHEVARRLRAVPENSGVYLVAVTGWEPERALPARQRSCFDRYLAKPLSAGALEEVLALCGR
jgi:CheY-like chemotaxis protein